MILNKIPLPPSINACLMPKGNRLIKTQAYRIYNNIIQLYKLKNFRQIEEALKKIDPKKVYQVNITFVFLFDRIYTKKNEIKQIDTNNFIKPLIDGIVSILDNKIDDKMFKAHKVDLLTCVNSKDEQAIIEFIPYDIKSF